MNKPACSLLGFLILRLSWVVLPAVVAAVLLPDRVWLLFRGGHATVDGYRDRDGPVDFAWMARFEPGGVRLSRPSASAFSVDGEMLFVTGVASGRRGRYQFVTIAYDVFSGEPRWTVRDPSRQDPRAADKLLVCPGGERLFVSGWRGEAGRYDYVLLAYGLPEGRRLWEVRYRGGPGASGYDLAAAPCGGGIYVAGNRPAWTGGVEPFLSALDSETGSVLWENNVRVSDGAQVTDVRVAADSAGDSVYTVGLVAGNGSAPRWVVSAYGAEGGAGRWERSYEFSTVFRLRDLVLAPESGVVYAGGTAVDPMGFPVGGAVLAIDGRTGGRLWMDIRKGTNRSVDRLAVDSAGGRLLAAGGSGNDGARVGRVTAYRMSTGNVIWMRETPGVRQVTGLAFASGEGYLAAIGPRGSGARQAAAVAFDAETGTERWTASFGGHDAIAGIAMGVAMTPDGAGIAITSVSAGSDGRTGYLTALLRDRATDRSREP